MKIDVTTVAIAAGAAYLLLSKKEDGTDSATFEGDPVDPLEGECPPGFSPSPQGFCLPDEGQEFDLPGSEAPKTMGYGIDGGLAPSGESDPGLSGASGLAGTSGSGGQAVPPATDLAALMQALTTGKALPGGFYQVKSGDRLNKIAEAAIEAAVTYRAEQLGASPAEIYSLTSSAVASYRTAYREAIQCSPFNDSLYSEWAYPANALPGPGGRALRLRPKHFDNFARMSAGEPPARNVRWGAPTDPTPPRTSSRAPVFGDETSYSLLWLPGIDLDLLVTPDLQLGALETPEWPNSVWGQIVPPPPIMQLGFIDYDDVSAPGQIGCKWFTEDYPG